MRKVDYTIIGGVNKKILFRLVKNKSHEEYFKLKFAILEFYHEYRNKNVDSNLLDHFFTVNSVTAVENWYGDFYNKNKWKY